MNRSEIVIERGETRKGRGSGERGVRFSSEPAEPTHLSILLKRLVDSERTLVVE